MLTTLNLPSSCLTEIWMSDPPGTGGPGPVLGNPHDPSCWPGTHDPSSSIALASCPPGYSSACAPERPADEAETAFYCCPSRYSCDGGYYDCTRNLGSTVLAEVKDLGDNDDTVTVTLTTDGYNAHAIQIRYHASDLVTTTSSGLTSSQTSQDSSSRSSPNSGAASETATSNVASSNGLSSGAIAGIAIGAAVLGFAIAIACFLLWRRRKGRGVNSQQQVNPERPDQGFTQPEQSQMFGYQPALVQPQGKSNVSELPGYRTAQELDSTPH